jgi:hypothetical protein
MLYGPNVGGFLLLLLGGVGCIGIGVLLSLFGIIASSKAHAKNRAIGGIVFGLAGGLATLPFVPAYSLAALIPLGLSGLVLQNLKTKK